MPLGLEPVRAVAMVLALGAADAADGPSTACTLRVEADPPVLMLGNGDHAQLRLEANGGEAPAVAASVGRIEQLRQLAPGVYSAELVPPAESWPQVAIVIASGPAGCGWVAIPLIGQGDALVRSAPRAPITVRIGTRDFGPVVADAHGHALVPVVVPPGIDHVMHGRRAIPLNVPPGRHVHLLLDHVSGPADREEVIEVRAFTVTAAGAPWTGPPPVFSVSHGAVSEAIRAAPGEFVARWRLSSGPAGTAKLSARLGDEPLAAEALVTRAPGRATALDIRLGRERFTAGEDPIQVEVRAVDAAGNPTDDATLRLESDFGAIAAVDRDGPGRFRTTLALPCDLTRRSRAVVTASSGSVVATAAVVLRPGAPDRITLEPRDSSVRAESWRNVRVRVAVVDRCGNPVDTAPPRLVAERGDLGTAAVDEAGWFAARYRPPLLGDDARDVIRAEAAQLGASTEVRLVAPWTRLEVTPKLGIATSGSGTALHMGAELAAWTRRFGPDLGLALDVGWSSFSRADAVSATGVAMSLDATASYLSILANLVWRRSVGPRSMVWASAGGGAVRAASSVTVTGVPTVNEAGWAPAATAGVAWGLRMPMGFPFVELRARWQGDPALQGLRGSLVPLTFDVGWRIEAL